MVDPGRGPEGPGLHLSKSLDDHWNINSWLEIMIKGFFDRSRIF